ncbi:MAG TPA: ChbG/HpnK family deacetylase [Vitreimonas sp.]|nr:ChbG/HpnK family deacetylase [Vitreimonas sp.]
MKHLVLVADDFGLTPGINRGCIAAIQTGILTELSLMMDSPATAEGVKAVLDNNIHGLGIHITLHDIVGTGRYLKTDDYKQLLAEAPAATLANRVRVELQKFEELTGRIPTHINGHKNCHLHPKVIDVVNEYALQHDIFVRPLIAFSDGNSAGQDMNDVLLQRGVKLTDYIFEHIVGSFDEAQQGFVEDFTMVADNTVTEFFFHPAYVDDLLRQFSSLVGDRERDVKLLTDSEFKNQLETQGAMISGFGDI